MKPAKINCGLGAIRRAQADRVRRAPFGFLGGQRRILRGHPPGQGISVHVGPPRARA